MKWHANLGPLAATQPIWPDAMTEGEVPLPPSVVEETVWSAVVLTFH